MFTSLGHWPPTRYPLAWVPEDWDSGTSDAFAALLALTDPALVYVLVAEPFDPAGTGEALGLPPPLGFLPLAGGPAFTYQGVAEQVYLASDNYLTRAADTPASTPIPGVLTPAYSIRAVLGSEEDPIGDAVVEAGDITIRNGTGDRDGLVDLDWVGRSLQIRAGDPDWAFSQFVTVLRGTVSGVRYTETAIHLGADLRDALFDLNLTREYYAGTGGAEGPAELAGIPKPLAIGRCRQVPLRQVNAGLQIWQAGEVIADFIAVRDIGLEVTDSTDNYADYAALAAASVSPGEYATCLAEGLVRFGSDVTVPTADVDGDPAAGTDVPDLVQWLLTNRLPVGAKLDSDEVEAGSFNTASTARGWRAGLHLTDEMTGREAVRILTRSIGGYVAPSRAGLLTMGLFSDPAGPVASLDASVVDDAGPEMQRLRRPAGKVTVGYRPNWRPLRDSEMSETVGADRENFRLDYRTVSATATLNRRDAVDYRIDTTLDDADDAQDLADLLVTLLSGSLRYFRVPLRTLSLPYWVGDRVSFAFDRWGLSAGDTFIIVEVDEDSEGERSLVLWG